MTNKQKKPSIEVVDIESLVHDDKNFNRGTEEGGKLIARSFKEHGAGRSVLLDKNNRLVAGNKAAEGAREAGIRRVIVVETEGDEMVAVRRKDVDLDTAEGRKMALLDNLTQQVSLAWDTDAIQSVQAEIPEFDIADFGFDIGLPTGDPDEADKVTEDDFDPDKDMPQGDGNIKQGDIFRLGDHLLMCSDSTNADHLTKLLSDGKPDLVFTDPPYGISVVSDKGTIGSGNVCKPGVYMPVKGDETTDTAQKNFELLKSIGCEKFIIWGGNYFVPFLPFSPSWIIWDKRGDMNSNNFADGEMAWCSFNTPVRIYKQLWNGMIREGESEKRVHPTQKPIRLLGEIMNDFSAENDIVLDCFGGSGSTLIACEQVKRKCRMIEYEPYYVNVIIARWEKLTGGKAVKIEG